jgi:hypothetical protein
MLDMETCIAETADQRGEPASDLTPAEQTAATGTAPMRGGRIYFANASEPAMADQLIKQRMGEGMGVILRIALDW